MPGVRRFNEISYLALRGRFMGRSNPENEHSQYSEKQILLSANWLRTLLILCIYEARWQREISYLSLRGRFVGRSNPENEHSQYSEKQILLSANWLQSLWIASRYEARSQ